MQDDVNRGGTLLKTFGGAVLKSSSGDIIDLPPKPLAVLVLLRLHEPTSRRELERLLWQGMPGDAGNSLSQALGPLRRLFPDLPRGKGAVAWPGRELLACDVDVLKRGERETSARCDAIFAYNGVFLKDFRTEEGEGEFRHWVQHRQDEFEALFRRIWDEEVADAVLGGRWDQLEKLARHAVALDRYWQPGHAALVRALASSGNPDAARRYFASARHQIGEDGDGEDVLEQVLGEAGARIDEWASHSRRLRVLLDGAAEPGGTAEAASAAKPPPPHPEPAREQDERGGRPAPWRTPPQRRRAAVVAGGLLAAGVALLLVLPPFIGRRARARESPRPGWTRTSMPIP